ncbi:MAG: BadF/BadG/BcrA/BcrD type ATPase [Thermomicrobia bacterium]|nr:BadF/BadG/BcrA/BcrD type ATPase [Thermomicrobia bacterium]
MTESFFLGVDGGATKTVAVVVDAAGREIGRGMAGSGNQAAVGLERAVASIRGAVAEAARHAGGGAFRAAWIGLAGVDRPGDRDRLLPHLAMLADVMRLTNDAELALTGLAGAVGVAVIAGTGSIAVGRDATGKMARAGGWGHIIGDEGSGYELGRLALKAAARAADGRGPQTALLPAIVAEWRLSRPDAMIDRVYPDGEKGQIARLSALVFAAARDGDAVARGIVREAATELALAALAVGEKLGFPDDRVPIALAGGMLIHEADFRAAVLRRLRRRRPVGQVALVADPASSAARAAMHLMVAAL